jgi:hypothetical protein
VGQYKGKDLFFPGEGRRNRVAGSVLFIPGSVCSFLRRFQIFQSRQYMEIVVTRSRGYKVSGSR